MYTSCVSTVSVVLCPVCRGPRLVQLWETHPPSVADMLCFHRLGKFSINSCNITPSCTGACSTHATIQLVCNSPQIGGLVG
jgi:hypothetical protein